MPLYKKAIIYLTARVNTTQVAVEILKILRSPEISDWKVEKCRNRAGHMLRFKTNDPDIASTKNQKLILELRSSFGMRANCDGNDYFPLIESQELVEVLSYLRNLVSTN